MPKRPRKKPKSIEQLLAEQTTVILDAVDQRLTAQGKRIDERFAAQDKRLDEKFALQNIEILSAVDKRLEKLEERFTKKLNELTNTLDKFLKRLADQEEEFTFMKNDINRIKAVLRD